MAESTPTPLGQAKARWDAHVDDVQAGRSARPDNTDIADITQMAISFSVADSLEKIAAAVDDGNLNFWVERFGRTIETGIFNGFQGGRN